MTSGWCERPEIGVASSGRDGAAPPALGQNEALYCSSADRKSFKTTSGSPPVLRTLSAHVLYTGSADAFHSLSCSSLTETISCPGRSRSLLMPAASKSAHGSAKRAAQSLVQ